MTIGSLDKGPIMITFLSNFALFGSIILLISLAFLLEVDAKQDDIIEWSDKHELISWSVLPFVGPLVNIAAILTYYTAMSLFVFLWLLVSLLKAKSFEIKELVKAINDIDSD